MDSHSRDIIVRTDVVSARSHPRHDGQRTVSTTPGVCSRPISRGLRWQADVGACVRVLPRERAQPVPVAPALQAGVHRASLACCACVVKSQLTRWTTPQALCIMSTCMASRDLLLWLWRVVAKCGTEQDGLSVEQDRRGVRGPVLEICKGSFGASRSITRDANASMLGRGTWLVVARPSGRR